MPRDATATRERLVDEAAKAFAEHGVRRASLIEITRSAGQRNRNAVHYHFGSRTGLICAVIDRHSAFLAEREGELLEVARRRDHGDVASVVEAIVRPSAELGATGWSGRCFLQIVAELIDEDPTTIEPEITAALARTGGDPVYELLAERLAHLPQDLYVERISLATTSLLRAAANRARDPEGRRGRPQLAEEAFVQNLVGMVTAALTAPIPPALQPPQKRRRTR